MLETNRVEYKRELTSDLEKEVVAFLNYKEGGVLYIGVTDNGNIVGLVHPDRDALKIKDRLKTNIGPSCLGLFDVINQVRDKKEIPKIIIASGPEKPYQIKKYGCPRKAPF